MRYSESNRVSKMIFTNVRNWCRFTMLMILNVIHHVLSKLGLTTRKVYVHEIDTTQRVHLAAELEAKAMAKMPKFKARPLNKKENPGKPHLTLTEPKTPVPVLQTSLRARPAKVEQEELEKIPKFKAKPLNKKIFENKGDIGIFCNTKKHVTVPQEFHFATNERIPPPASMTDLFDKLTLKSESAPNRNPIPRNTTPNPFHLHTQKLYMELLQKQSERARVPKANPYPCTTDYHVIPPKPEPKQCTKPAPFQRLRMEREEAEMRRFKAQPILKEDPIPLPKKVRKPLTQVQEFSLRVDHRARTVDRAQYCGYCGNIAAKHKLRKIEQRDEILRQQTRDVMKLTQRKWRGQLTST